MRSGSLVAYRLLRDFILEPLMKRIHHLIAFAAMLVLPLTSVHAAVLLYDFENQPLGTETPFTLQAGGVVATLAGSGDDATAGAFAISSNFATPTGFQYRLMNGDFLTIGSAFGAPGSVLTIAFASAVTAISVNFALDDPSNVASLAFTTNAGGSGSASGSLSPGFRYPEGMLVFSGQPFTLLTLRSSAIDFQIDDLRATTVAALPEPATLWLIAGGLPVVLVLRRRERRPGAR